MATAPKRPPKMNIPIKPVTELKMPNAFPGSEAGCDTNCGLEDATDTFGGSSETSTLGILP